MATITKKELVEQIAERTQIRRGVTRPIIQALLDEIVTELAKGNRLEFRGFGIFEPKKVAARKAQNPQTLEQVRIPARRTVKFKMGRLMKQKLKKQ